MKGAVVFEQFGAPKWADRADSRPPGYEYLVRSGLAGVRIRPWMILALDDAATLTNQVAELFPSRKLVAFAIRTDQLDVACWDAESNDHRIYSIDSYDSGEKWAYMQTHTSLSNWLRAVLEMCQEDDLISWYGTLEPGQRPEDLPRQHDELRQHLDASSITPNLKQDAPQWLQDMTYDPHYQILEYHELTSCDLPPWFFLSENEIIRVSATLSTLFPNRRLVAYARRHDTGALACWDLSRRDYTIYALDRWWENDSTGITATYPDLFAWQRQALEDFISAGPQVESWLGRAGDQPFEN